METKQELMCPICDDPMNENIHSMCHHAEILKENVPYDDDDMIRNDIFTSVKRGQKVFGEAFASVLIAELLATGINPYTLNLEFNSVMGKIISNLENHE